MNLVVGTGIPFLFHPCPQVCPTKNVHHEDTPESDRSCQPRSRMPGSFTEPGARNLEPGRIYMRTTGGAVSRPYR